MSNINNNVIIGDEDEEPTSPLITSSNDKIISEEEKKKQNRSINIMVLTVFLQSIGFTLIMPSMLKYLEENTPQYYDDFGYIVALYSVGQFIGSPIFGKWSNKRPASEPIIVSVIFSIIGSIFYSISYKFKGLAFPLVLGMSRFVVGIGAGNVSVCRAYATETATIENKTQIMGKMSGAQGAGFVLGPGMGLLLSFVNFSIGGIKVDGYTSPGYFSIIIAILNIVLLLVYFKDGRDLAKRNKKKVVDSEKKSLLSINDEESGDEEKVNLDQALLPIILSIFLFMVVITIFAVFETCLTLMTLRYYDWSTLQNSAIMGASGVFSVFIFILISRPFIKKYDDRKTALFGFANLLIALLLLVNYRGSYLPMWQFFIGVVFVSIGYPIASSLVYAIFSKVLNPNSHTQGTKMGWLTAGGSLARMAGPLWSQEIWDYTGLQGRELYLVTAGITFIAILIFIAFYKKLSPHPQFKLQQLSQDQTTTSTAAGNN